MQKWISTGHVVQDLWYRQPAVMSEAHRVSLSIDWKLVCDISMSIPADWYTRL